MKDHTGAAPKPLNKAAKAEDPVYAEPILGNPVSTLMEIRGRQLLSGAGIRPPPA